MLMIKKGKYLSGLAYPCGNNLPAQKNGEDFLTSIICIWLTVTKSGIKNAAI